MKLGNFSPHILSGIIVNTNRYPNFDPGGQTVEPPPHPCGCPLLHVQFQPRYSLYVSTETTGEFVVNAAFSPYHGTIWPPTNSTTRWAGRLVFSINSVETDAPLVQATVPVNTTGNRFPFNLSHLGPPRLEPYPVVLYGAPESGQPSWTATANVSYLPDKTNGSITRIDSWKGGLWVKNAASNNTFEPYLPYGFYASHDNFLRENDTKLIDAYRDLGLTGMVPLASWAEIPEVLSHMDGIDLKYMYNLRYGYKNLSYVEENVLRARGKEGLFAYWTADEYVPNPPFENPPSFLCLQHEDRTAGKTPSTSPSPPDPRSGSWTRTTPVSSP